MGNTLIGALLCIGGSWGSNLANVSLKQLDNVNEKISPQKSKNLFHFLSEANDKLEREGKERMGLYNYYNYK